MYNLIEYVILPKVCNYIFSDLWHKAGGAALGLSCVACSEALAFASASAAAPYYANAIRCIVSASQLVTLKLRRTIRPSGSVLVFYGNIDARC